MSNSNYQDLADQYLADAKVANKSGQISGSDFTAFELRANRFVERCVLINNYYLSPRRFEYFIRYLLFNDLVGLSEKVQCFVHVWIAWGSPCHVAKKDEKDGF